MKTLGAFILGNARFLGYGFALTLLSSFGQTFFISLFNDEICRTFELSDGAYGSIYAIATLVSGFVLLQTGVLVDRFDLRPLTTVLLVGLAIAALLMGLAPAAAVLAIGIFLLRQCGQGLLGHTAITSMARYFGDGRGKAMAIASLGFAAGEAVLPFVAVITMKAIGWRETWFAVAALLVVIAVPIALWLLRGHGERHARYLADLREPATSSGTARSLNRRQWTRREVLRDMRFYLLVPAITAPAFVVTGFFFLQTRLVEEKGWTLEYFAACFTAFAAAQVPAGLIAGPLVDRVGAQRLTPWFLVPLCGATLLLAVSDHRAAAVGFMFLTGLTAGMIGTIVGALWAELYGVMHLGSIRALASSIMVFSTAASPFLMGQLFDRGITLSAMAWASVGGIAVAMVLAVVAMARSSGNDDGALPSPSE